MSATWAVTVFVVAGVSLVFAGLSVVLWHRWEREERYLLLMAERISRESEDAYWANLRHREAGHAMILNLERPRRAKGL